MNDNKQSPAQIEYRRLMSVQQAAHRDLAYHMGQYIVGATDMASAALDHRRRRQQCAKALNAWLDAVEAVIAHCEKHETPKDLPDGAA